MIGLGLGGCRDDDEKLATFNLVPESSATPQPAPGVTPPPAPSPTNRVPTISGSPATSAKANQDYSFQPTASDPDGDTLTFQIANKPAWASFDVSTGRLSGTPSSTVSGTFASIRISVSDGQASSTLPAFSVDVASATLGTATLSWQPPTENTDGSPLTNLAGFIVRYGTTLEALSEQVRLSNPGLATYLVENLTPATWYFQVSAFNSAGVESAPSVTGMKTIR
ncbi:MAG: fibronectin type III domain-containing protein [Steroidobacteraceae bacterium]|nr:fibronectin type III domain-containing protein [Steroidobacteraceae bacterium]